MRDAISDKFNGKIGSPMFAMVGGDQVTLSRRGAPSNDKVLEVLTNGLKRAAKKAQG